MGDMRWAQLRLVLVGAGWVWRDDALYDVVGELGWNDAPVQPQRGSAIFLHLARPDWGPTEGCVALALPDLLWLLEQGATALDMRA